MKTYQALRTEPNLISSSSIHKFQVLSFLALGILIHLRWYGAKTLEQLSEIGTETRYSDIRFALDQLIKLQLVEELELAEVPGGAA